MSWQEYNDAASQAVFKRFEERLRPLMAEVSPDWLLHHIEMLRRPQPQGDGFDEQVEIRLVIRPLGSAHFKKEPAQFLAIGAAAQSQEGKDGIR